MRVQGYQVDEVAAQFALSGSTLLLDGVPAEELTQARNLVLGPDKRKLMKKWERLFPDKDPYPPSFAEQVHDLVRKALQAVDSEEDPVYRILLRLQERCIAELSTELF